MKLVNRTSGLGATCDPQKFNDCPSAFITIWNGVDVIIFQGQWKTYANAWSVNSFNQLLADFTLPANALWDGSIGAVKIEFRNFPVEKNLVLGNVVLSPN